MRGMVELHGIVAVKAAAHALEGPGLVGRESDVYICRLSLAFVAKVAKELGTSKSKDRWDDVRLSLDVVVLDLESANCLSKLAWKASFCAFSCPLSFLWKSESPAAAEKSRKGTKSRGKHFRIRLAIRFAEQSLQRKSGTYR